MAYKDREAQREYQRKWVAARRAAWFEKNGPCTRCGSRVDLEVDHVDGTKKVSHKVWSWSEARRDAELSKCQVLCKACHLAKSREAGEQPVASVHGTTRMYEHLGCRCSMCREAHRQYQRAWRESA